MVETDWREILSFSQRELAQTDKEKLCESLSWMEADDIELNFTDLKTLFRLSQDILKYKSEQVNNLLGQLQTIKKREKGGKTKVKSPYKESPSPDNMLKTIANQEEVIKVNRQVIEQLYSDIAELKGYKHKLEEEKNKIDVESESSRDTLSEMNAVVQLENEIAMKNRHIRKLLGDVKILEEENTKLKEKISVLKDKLTEATQLIDNLTEQLLNINNEFTQLKEILGKSEQIKSQQSIEIESLRKELFDKEYNSENIYEEMKSKVQQWKNTVRSKKAELEALTNENMQLKEDLNKISKPEQSPKINLAEELKIKELQDKLLEASNEIEQSANLINLLRAENRQLKNIIEEAPDYSPSDTRNESDDGKEQTIINKLKRKVKSLTISLQGAEEMIAVREKELSEITSQLQLLQSEEGVNVLLEGLKKKKRQLRFKDEGIKTLVQEVNTMSQLVNDLQLENETLRQRLNIPTDEKVAVTGILHKYHDLEQNNADMCKEIRNLESKLVCVELENRSKDLQITKTTKILETLGYNNIEEICQSIENDKLIKPIDGSEPSVGISNHKDRNTNEKTNNFEKDAEIQAIVEENEGLRKGLQEILNFLKDNSTTSSGILALECPSLEAILRSMEARHTAGWFAPHMATVLELKTAIGGKDALLSALHEARKETFDVMTQLTEATNKSSNLEQKLLEMEYKFKQKEIDDLPNIKNNNLCEFGTWISNKEYDRIDFHNRNDIEDIMAKGSSLYEGQLKKGLAYFHERFKTLFERMTAMEIRATDEHNKWSLQEEQYKAQIENLVGQLQQKEDPDISENSSGVVPIQNINFLQRKCSYLEESYKYIRTLNENMKNENLESKRDAMITSSKYETEIQRLILAVANLTDKLRYSISIELFWKQNFALNETTLKYRKLIEDCAKEKDQCVNLLKRLEDDKIDVINKLQKEINQTAKTFEKSKEKMFHIEESIIKKQIEQLCCELEVKNKKINYLETRNIELQEAQAALIDNTLAKITKEETELMKDQLQKLTEENKILKEQCHRVSNKLDVALLQMQDHQQRQMSNDIEINLLRHQILDLQSTGDNKAIVARLSGEILAAHIQTSEGHKKLNRIWSTLNREKELRIEAEELLKARQKLFDVYTYRYESKFRYMYEVMKILRQQYQGSLPIISIQNYLDKMEDLSRETYAVNEKLYEIEDLRSSLMMKHSVFDQILDISKNKCLIEENSCPHKIKQIVEQSIQSRELNHINKKLKALEQSREELTNHCNYLEKTLVLVNQGFEKPAINNLAGNRSSEDEVNISNLQVEDIQSDEEPSSRRSRTITLPKPQLLKPSKNSFEKDTVKNEQSNAFLSSSIKYQQKSKQEIVFANVHVQTASFETYKKNTIVQTDEDESINEVRVHLDMLKKDNERQKKELDEAITLVKRKTEEILILNTEKINLENKIQNLKQNNTQKDKLNERLHADIEEFRTQLENFRTIHIAESNKKRDAVSEQNKSLLMTLGQLEKDKKIITAEYKELLNNEREEYSKTVKDLNVKIMELQTKLDRRGSDSNATNAETLKEVISKYTVKIVELEDKCFKLQNALDECKAERTTCQSEMDRWKDLASERLTKMEQLNSQLEERHCHEVESYKAENQHWLSQWNETQREHMELRSRLTEQKALHVKQLAEKDAQIEQLCSVVNNLKTQVINMQTMISVNDPSFDLSAIVEVDEASDAMSHRSDRLELNFDSTIDLRDVQDDFVKMPASSTSIWQEPVIERLRREKQLIGKQNAILRRQIKALASRERRSRLDAQNLRNQVFRISTNGGKVATAESAALQNKIATLQAQLTSARRDTHSSVALWDKWKRAQQASDRWQARYEEKFQEVKKLESGLNLAKSALARLDREKRVLLSRLTEVKNEKQLAIEKQDGEPQEKSDRSIRECVCRTAPPISSHALLERVQAQQRRIVALEVAEKGNELLVSEYEKSLAEITSLKGQVLKLESTLLESQIRTPLKSTEDTQPELDYWKSYCEMLKDENIQLTHKVNSMETTPHTAHQHRINDLERTVLTLRGLVSKLQADQKTSGIHKRIDSRTSSGNNASDKNRHQLEPYRTEIANLKRSIHDKDLLLEKSKDMLKIAAEREDELLREDAFLRRRIDELTRPNGGFLSA